MEKIILHPDFDQTIEIDRDAIEGRGYDRALLDVLSIIDEYKVEYDYIDSIRKLLERIIDDIKECSDMFDSKSDQDE